MSDDKVRLWRANDASGITPRWRDLKPKNDIFYTDWIARPVADDSARALLRRARNSVESLDLLERIDAELGGGK